MVAIGQEVAASQGYAVGSISAARSIVCWTDGGY